jgi:hypothetical protein
MGFGSSLKSALGIASGPRGSFTPGADLNKQEDLYNRYNINSALGSRSFSTDSSGRSVLNIEETPFQKAFRGLQENQAINTLSSKTYGPEDFAAQGKQINDALYNSSYNNLRPQFEQEDTRTRDYLSNRGLSPTSDAYRKALSNIYRDRGNQLNQLSLQSVLAGAQEQDRLTRLAEATRAARLAETGNVTQGIDLGFFGNVANINAAQNISNQEGAQNAYNLSNFQDTQKRRSAAVTEGLKTGGSALAAVALGSDRNLKENIELVGKENGFNIYEFNYKNKPERYQGVMAQEVQKTRPDAVIMKDGYLAVYYDKIGVEFKKVN